MSHFLVAGDPETWSLPSESVVQVDLRPGDPEPRRPETRRSGSLSDEGPQLRTDLEEELLRAVTLSEGLRGMGSHWASIAQGNPELKEKGILGLAGFLDKADHLTVLWSAMWETLKFPLWFP
ncbi:Mal-A2 [Symbiodinium sp. KB8]|nr:Mal-A2 [Symbiodinium sp. KB8]